ncbi:hypothetical protein SLEP1_g14678 [Rubroshorea leprosula]|uniref:Uncharacterized protein n=1 Tax=Rubroshorea leprosula TaxID=152421 RepID=A0AAV5IQT0_9ROSI|nr:hypothetical protein SLEP1_g14678 [Rubroshorea leprosula]
MVQVCLKYPEGYVPNVRCANTVGPKVWRISKRLKFISTVEPKPEGCLGFCYFVLMYP